MGAAFKDGEPKAERIVLERQGEGLIHEARAAEDQGDLDAAYDLYRQGMTVLPEAAAKLDNKDPLAKSMGKKVMTYMEQAEGLKARLEDRPLPGHDILEAFAVRFHAKSEGRQPAERSEGSARARLKFREL